MEHTWIYRDEYVECTSCRLEANFNVLSEGLYPSWCESEVCRANGLSSHYLVVVRPTIDEELHSECYHCARQF